MTDCKHSQPCSGESREARVKAIINQHAGDGSALLKVLHAIQNLDEQNYLTEQELTAVAAGLAVPLSKVYGVATFYSMYSVKPRGRHIIRVCENAPCHVVGAAQVIEALQQELGIGIGETSADGRFTLELSSCLGVCGVAPAMMIDQVVHGNLTPEKLSGILAEYE
jgi:NADH:ubiquinone oxidoreductase subunit E